jgi:hypothetical protein
MRICKGNSKFEALNPNFKIPACGRQANVK